MSTVTDDVKVAVKAFVTAHYSKLVSAAVGYAAAKFGVLGFIWKVL